MQMTLRQKIINETWHALTDDAFVREPGMCQKFVRQVVQSVAGGKFDALWRGTADKTARAFLHTKFAHIGAGFGEPGDLLYWFGSGRQTAGHAAINLDGQRIAQNSITDKWDKASGNKGTRLISTMRAPDLVVKLDAA